MVKKSQSVLHVRDPKRAAWANWKPTPRDRHVAQWVNKAHGSYVKQEVKSSGSGVAPATEDPWSLYVPSQYSRPPATIMFLVKRKVKVETGSVRGVTPCERWPCQSRQDRTASTP